MNVHTNHPGQAIERALTYGTLSRMKIDTAKQLIRSEQMNFTQISEKLGYASIHYFSRQFKKVTGMTPSEYASSIKAIADRKQERFFDSPHH